MQVFSFFAQSLQTFEIQTHKILSAKKMKKTYIIICIYQKSGIYLPSNSGKKPERTTIIYHLLNFFIMKHISKISQKGMNYLHSFEIAKANNVNCLEKVYGRYSNEKARAFYLCDLQRIKENATSDGYIIGSNCNVFTYAFETSEGLRIETACNSYIIK